MKMRPLIGVAVLLAVSLAGFASKEETLQALIARADAAPLRDRPALYIEIATRQLKSADELYDEGKADEARAAVQEVVTYSSKARDAAVESNKRLKNTELAVRSMARHLQDMKHTLNYYDQAPVQAAADRLENLADDLLSHMFGKAKR
jgi:polyhydroxyalkanoate synthesis regulator phasin